MKRINNSSNFVIIWTLLFGLILFSSACSTFVTQTQSNITNRPSENELNFYINKSKQVLACVKQPGGVCPADVKTDTTFMKASTIASEPKYKAEVIKALINEKPITKQNILKSIIKEKRKILSSNLVGNANVKAANFAAVAITNPTAVKLGTLYLEASGIKDPQSEKSLTITISKNEVSQYCKYIQEATNFNGWKSLRYYLQGQLLDEKSLSDKSLDDWAKNIAIKSTLEQLTITEAYLAAYFNNGEFVSLDIDVNNVEASAIKAIKEKFKVSDEVAKELSVKLLTAIIGAAPGEDNKYHILTKKIDGGFVTRGGTKYSFPGVSINIDPLSDSILEVAEIDFTQVGSDVVRVFLEALGDQLGQLPADQTSTACKAIKNKQFEQYENFKCYVESEQVVDADQFTKVNEHANKAESLAATATGQVLRGVSWLSLNNEALAKIIETAVGVVARKATEKVAWCVYACLQEKDSELAFYSNDWDIRTIRLSVER
jgi:hypothetical protein